MKKFIKYAALLFTMMLVLSGCGNQLQEETYKMDKDGIAMTVKLSAHGDKVFKQETKSVIDYKKLGLTQDLAQKTLTETAKQFAGMKGVKTTVKVDGSKATENMTVNYDKMSDKDIKKANEKLGLSGKNTIKKNVSLEKTGKQLKKTGLKKVK